METNRKAPAKEQGKGRPKINYSELTPMYERLIKSNAKLRHEFISGNEFEVIKKLEGAVLKGPLSFQSLKLILELLQLSDDPKLFNRISLREIEMLYKKLCAVFKEDIDLNFEYFYFLKNIAGKEVLAHKFISKYKSYILKKFDSVD